MKIGSVIITKDDLNILQKKIDEPRVMMNMLHYRIELETCIKQVRLDILNGAIRWGLTDLKGK